MDENLRSEMNLTFTEISTLLGASLCVGVAVLDAATLHTFGKDIDYGLISLGVGALLGFSSRIGSGVK